jgi:radical SAM superfamily enzyme YgiQ (UPF0313 family)
MRLGLITAIREDHESPVEYFMKRHMANLAPLYLAAYLEQNAGSVEIQIKDHLKDLESWAPQVLGISSVTENIEFARRLAREAKEKWNPITILGGVHITSLPRTLPAEFDIGVVGEGEETLLALVKLFRQKGTGLHLEELKKIPGLVFHTPQGIVQTSMRKGIQNLDFIPFPAREKFIKVLGTTYMMTSRGCPYTCDFCVIPTLSEGYRKNSPEYVLGEIKSIRTNYPNVKHIRIFDDLYIVDKNRVVEIAERVDGEGLNKELSFACWGRANLIDERMVHAFKKMNMAYVAFGAESGSSKVMSKVKPGCSVEENQRAINLLADNGIRTSCSFIMGHPGETEEDLLATYRFIEKNLSKLCEIEFNVAIPWPGTGLWNYSKNKGLVSEDMSFANLRECGYFANYSTDIHPYLNDQIAPERFDQIMVDFKKLFWKMAKKFNEFNIMDQVNPRLHLPQLY